VAEVAGEELAMMLAAIVENRRKHTENRSIVFVFIFLDGNRSGNRTAGNENGSGINGNTKMGKYDRKIDGNER
jgi:hypothetical protein